MPIREPRITSKELAQTLIARVTVRIGRRGGRSRLSRISRPKLTKAVLDVLKELGHQEGYSDCYPWLADLVWWDKKSEYMALAVESELSRAPNEIADDFQKLTALKCPLKLFVFKGDVEKTKRMAERYLKSRGQHIKDEEYLLVGFTAPTPRCFLFKVPRGHELRDEVEFSELSSPA